MFNSEVKKYLTGLAVAQQLEKLAAQYKIDRKTQVIIEDIVAANIQGGKEISALAAELQAKANLNFTVALNLGYDLYETILLKVPAELRELLAQSQEPATLKTAELAKLLEEIKAVAQIQIAPQQETRFNNIIFNWWRDIRDDLETLDAFNKSEANGGLGLDRTKSSNLLNIIKQKEIEYQQKEIDILALISQELVLQAPIFSQSEVRESEIDVTGKAGSLPAVQEKLSGQDVTIDKLLALQERFKQIRSKIPAANKSQLSPLAQAIEAEEDFLQSTAELPPPPPAVINRPEIISTPQPQPARRVESSIQPPIVNRLMTEVKQPLFKQAAVPVSARPRVDDVKFTSQLIGPIDELAVLKIADFRRLSKSPVEAAAKIKSKLDLLEDESMLKRAAGIKALKSSPLYKAYADIMNKSIKDSKSFEDIIAGQETITLEEFKAIMELNKSLKY